MYRSGVQAVAELDRPYVMLGVNVFAADTDDEARLLFTSLQQAFVNLRRGRPPRLPPPVSDFDRQLAPAERAMIEHALSCTAIGGPEAVRAWLEAFIARTDADELILASQIFDPAARVRSLRDCCEGPRNDVLGPAASSRGAAGKLNAPFLSRPLDRDLRLVKAGAPAGRAPARLGQPVGPEDEIAGSAPGGFDDDPVALRFSRPQDVPQIVLDVTTTEAQLPRNCGNRAALSDQAVEQLFSERHVAQTLRGRGGVPAESRMAVSRRVLP